MKIAVFSDIHGNLKALKTVLEQIREKKADLTIFLGDIFQRGNEEFALKATVSCMRCTEWM